MCFINTIPETRHKFFLRLSFWHGLHPRSWKRIPGDNFLPLKPICAIHFWVLWLQRTPLCPLVLVLRRRLPTFSRAVTDVPSTNFILSRTTLACRQPQLFVFPDCSSVWPTTVIFPQSQRQRQTVVPDVFRGCVDSMATNLPKRCPVISRCPGFTLVWHPQSRTVPRCYVLVPSSITPPQSHSHSQTVYPFLRLGVAERTVRFPIWNPSLIFALCHKTSLQDARSQYTVTRLLPP